MASRRGPAPPTRDAAAPGQRGPGAYVTTVSIFIIIIIIINMMIIIVIINANMFIIMIVHVCVYYVLYVR